MANCPPQPRQSCSWCPAPAALLGGALACPSWGAGWGLQGGTLIPPLQRGAGACGSPHTGSPKGPSHEYGGDGALGVKWGLGLGSLWGWGGFLWKK